MGTPKGAYSDYELLRSYQDTIQYLEDDLCCDVGTVVNLSAGRGRIGVRLEAYDAPVRVGQGPLASYETAWPGPKAESWPACLYSAAMKLVRLVEDSRRPALEEVPRVPHTPRRGK